MQADACLHADHVLVSKCKGSGSCGQRSELSSVARTAPAGCLPPRAASSLRAAATLGRRWTAVIAVIAIIIAVLPCPSSARGRAAASAAGSTRRTPLRLTGTEDSADARSMPRQHEEECHVPGSEFNERLAVLVVGCKMELRCQTSIVATSAADDHMSPTRDPERPAPVLPPLPAAGPCPPAPRAAATAAAGGRTVPHAASSRLSSPSQTMQAVMAPGKPGGNRAVRKRRSSSLTHQWPAESAHTP